MAIAARWIGMASDRIAALRAECVAFARAQGRRAAPAALWARLADGRLAFALVAPLKYAPGRARRWHAWALAPLAAACRGCGLRVYLDGSGICLGARRIAQCEAMTIGDCAVALSVLPLPQDDFLDRLRERIESQHGWQFDHSWPSHAERCAIEQALAGERVVAR